MIADFIHLRVQSSYSMLESALTIDKIIEITKTFKMPAVALSDRGNLFGSLEFSLAASKSAIQPIHGTIMNIAYSTMENDRNFAEILLIAKDELGYQNLLKLNSYTFIKNDRKICNHITIEDFSTHQDGLIALSCYTNGIIGKCLLEKNREDAILWSKRLQEILGDRFYFEIMRHNLENERFIEDEYIEIAKDLEVPLVATNNVLFSDVSMYDAHDVLLCIAEGVTKEHQDRKKVSNNCYFKSPNEMMHLFQDIPEAIENSINIAKRCYVMSEVHPPMLPNFSNNNVSESALIRSEAELGLSNRLKVKFISENIPTNDQEKIKTLYLERLNYELDIICTMNFSGYFLIVSDFIKWSKEQGISVGPGRGSGAGSMVAWCLLITDLDPIKFGLLFERFLNPERISMPDFDIDFCQERREEVINYVRSKYGDTRVGQIITFGKLQAKAVIKDVSRVLGLSYKYADYLTELVPFNAVNPITLDQAMNEVIELKEASKGRGLYNLSGEEVLIQQVLSTALILEGLHRHASIHAAGIVIAGKDLVDIVPVYKDTSSSMLVVQYSMKYADLAGLMKFDFLGLQTLTVITKCKDLLKKRGIIVDFDNISFDDAKTYEMLSKGYGIGVFQFESVGMKDTLKRLKPNKIDEIIALGALYRPGPMENIPTYIACKHNRQQPDYLHPLLKPLLEETYGVIIYQEQVLEIAKILAGYTLGAADLLRRAMGKKIKSEMAAQEELFINGAKANGVNVNQAKSIFDTVAKFAGYGFNKAHASAYGVISYQTAYLKANFPIEFLVTCLNLEIDNNDKINLFIQESKNCKIALQSPNINISAAYFSILDGDIVYALGAIKNVSITFAEIIVQERVENGLFKSIIDFMERIPPKCINRRSLENLIKAGCFDALHQNRNQLLLSIQKLISYSISYYEEKRSNQFSLINVNSVSKDILVEAASANLTTLAFDEFEVLGLFLNNHPLSEYQSLLEKLDVKNSLDHTDLPFGSNQIKIAGVIQKKDARMSARGRFITIQLSDQYGIFDLTIFSEEVLKNYVHLLNVKALVVAHCEVFKDEGNIRLTAKSFSSIEEATKEIKFDLKIYPKTLVELDTIIRLLNMRASSEKGNAIASIMLSADNNFVGKVSLAKYFSLEPQDLRILQEFYY